MLARKTPLRRTSFKRGKPKPERLALPVVPKATGRMRVSKGPARDKAHLAKVRQCMCLYCGNPHLRTEAHHCRAIGPRSLGKRVSDYLTVPVCSGCHAYIHSGNEAARWAEWNIDPRDWIRSFSTEGARALEEVRR